MSKRTFYLILTTLLISCTQPDKTSTNSNETGDNNPDFEFDGNYIPTKEFKIADHLLNSIEILTNDSLKGNGIELIYIRFTKPTDGGYYVITDTKFEGTKDEFSISAKDKVLGDIKITGKFLGKRGPRLDDIKDPSTIVFKGTISATGLNETLECKFYEGD